MSPSLEVLRKGIVSKAVLDLVDSVLPPGECTAQITAASGKPVVCSVVADLGETYTITRHAYIRKIFETVMAAPKDLYAQLEAAKSGVKQQEN